MLIPLTDEQRFWDEQRYWREVEYLFRRTWNDYVDEQMERDYARDARPALRRLRREMEQASARFQRSIADYMDYCDDDLLADEISELLEDVESILLD